MNNKLIYAGSGICDGCKKQAKRYQGCFVGKKQGCYCEECVRECAACMAMVRGEKTPDFFMNLLSRALPHLEHHFNTGDDRLDDLVNEIKRIVE